MPESIKHPEPTIVVNCFYDGRAMVLPEGTTRDDVRDPKGRICCGRCKLNERWRAEQPEAGA